MYRYICRCLYMHLFWDMETDKPVNKKIFQLMKDQVKV